MTDSIRTINLGGHLVHTDKPMLDREPNDFYPTPRLLCDSVVDRLLDVSHPHRVLDPGAGTGVWGQAVYDAMANRGTEVSVHGVELRDVPKPTGYNGWLKDTDFLDYDTLDAAGQEYDWVIGNPPYKHAEEFVRKSLRLVRTGGIVAFLLRLAFLEGQDRASGLWKHFPPLFVSVLAARPSFITDGPKAGKTDSAAYAVFVWKTPCIGSYPHIEWLIWR